MKRHPRTFGLLAAWASRHGINGGYAPQKWTASVFVTMQGYKPHNKLAREILELAFKWRRNHRLLQAAYRQDHDTFVQKGDHHPWLRA